MEHRKRSSNKGCPEDAQRRQYQGEQGEVPPRGCHYGAIQAPQCCSLVRDYEQGRTSESTACSYN